MDTHAATEKIDITNNDDVELINQIEAVHKILEVVCRITGLGFSAVARVTECKWIACAVRDEIAFGLKPGGELQLETTICNEIRQTGELVTIDHVAEDERFRDHHTPKMYGFQSYISVPIILSNGQFFGTLCAIDPRPSSVSKLETVTMFKLFAELIAMHIDTQRRMRASETELVSEKESAKLREQFIAVLGHDLRNPLAAIQSGTELLKLMSKDAETSEIVGAINRSVGRMSEMIENVLDLARGRMGGGMNYRHSTNPHLASELEQVVRELRLSAPGQEIQWICSITESITCDSSRLCQMLSNLIANAISHGDPRSPILISARTTYERFEISVENQGETIPSRVMDILFEPFARGQIAQGGQGLGLGLYISSEIARVHNGTLEATSEDGTTRFTFQMPTQASS